LDDRYKGILDMHIYHIHHDICSIELGCALEEIFGFIITDVEPTAEVCYMLNGRKASSVTRDAECGVSISSP